MRVLMLSHMYPSAVNPTAGIFVHEQVLALARRGHDVRVISPVGVAPPLVPRYRAHRSVPKLDFVEDVPVLHPRKLTLPRSLLAHRNADAMLAAIRGPIRRIQHRSPFDVIHAHMLVPDGWAAARIGAEVGLPVLATVHRADVLDVPGRGEGSRRRVVEAITAIDQIASVSAAIGEATSALAEPRRPIAVVPNGADARAFRPRSPEEVAAIRAELGLPVDEPVISYVGKLVPRKGVDHLVEALGLLAGRGVRFTVVAAGMGEMRPALERRAAELGIADRIRFVGKVPHETVPMVMAAGDVFVLPSLSEGLPTVVCEAMACGLPVVATAVDGTPEIVRDGETGLLVPPRAPEPLAEALGRIVGDPELAAGMGRRAHEIAMETYTWDANAAMTEALYEDIVA